MTLRQKFGSDWGRLGMTSKWNEVPLRELVGYISKGIAPSYATEETETTVRVLNQKCNRNFQINYGDSRLHDTRKKKIPVERYVKPNDILINSTGAGTAGRIARIERVPCAPTIDGHMILIRSNGKVTQKFLGYALKAHQWEVLQLDEGSTGQTELNRDRLLDEIMINYPLSFDEQDVIVDTLESIDRKMIANEQINDNLEQQAAALYGKYFPYAITDNLPDGWRIGTVGEIVEIHDSKRIPLSGAQRAKMEKRIYPYYGAASLMDYVDEYIFDGKYLLLGEDGTVVDDAGYPILQYVWGRFWVNNHAHILTGKLGFNVESLLLLFKRTPVKSIVTGAVQPKISQANLRSIQVVIPPQSELNAFNDLICPMFEQIRQNQDQNKALASLRDALLPKLMSGEIDVSNVQL